jgi:hypothetical protein
MKQTFFVAVLLMILSSCGLTESLKEMEDVKKDLQTTFKHEDIAMSMQRGSDEDQLSVTFVGYAIPRSSANDLSDLAVRVKKRILSRHPDLKKMDVIEVQFTGSDSEGTNQIATFRYTNR